jgi:hypothetical protein
MLHPLCAPLVLVVSAPLAAAQCEQHSFASDGDVGDDFGYALAAADDVLVVGARQDSDLGFWSGAAYVFERSGSGAPWLEVAKLNASDFADGDLFGRAVAVSAGRIVVGAPADDDHGLSTGAAYVFEKQGGQWVETDKLVPSGADADDWVGFAVVVDGDRILLGAQGDDHAGTLSGAAYVFDKSGGVWQESAYLTASDAGLADYFSFSVALSGDTLLIGAYGNDDHGTGSGSAYVFRKQSSAWVETQKLLASDAAVIDFFGWAVAMDGARMIIGAYGKDIVGGLDGAAYVFEEVAGAWVEQQRLTPAVQDLDGQFGYSVAVDGGRAVVGAVWADDFGTHSGAGYVFEEQGGVWSERARTAHPGQSAHDQLGWSVALVDDAALIAAVPTAAEGHVVSIAGPFDDCNGNGRVDHCDIAAGTSADADGDGVPDECVGVTEFCFCASGAPCGGSDFGAGCPSSRGVGGRFEYSSGTTSVAADDLVLTARELPQLAFALVFMGHTQMSPAVLGDGLRCVALPFHRFPVQSTGLPGAFDLGPGIVSTAAQSFGAAGHIASGDTWHFQCWYRDPASACATSNLTNALAVSFGL